MSMHKFQGLLQKGGDCDLWKALRELRDLETADVLGLGFPPWT